MSAWLQVSSAPEARIGTSHRPRPWQSSSAGASRPTRSPLAPPAAEHAFGRHCARRLGASSSTKALVRAVATLLLCQAEQASAAGAGALSQLVPVSSDARRPDGSWVGHESDSAAACRPAPDGVVGKRLPDFRSRRLNGSLGAIRSSSAPVAQCERLTRHEWDAGYLGVKQRCRDAGPGATGAGCLRASWPCALGG